MVPLVPAATKQCEGRLLGAKDADMGATFATWRSGSQATSTVPLVAITDARCDPGWLAACGSRLVSMRSAICSTRLFDDLFLSRGMDSVRKVLLAETRSTTS